MPQVATKEENIAKSCETSVWLAWGRTGFTIAGNPSKSPTGLHGLAKRPHGNASVSSQKREEGTDAACNIAELLDYYPYGSIRFDEQSGTDNRRKYIGQIYDPATQLSYLNARYYDGSRGQFLGEDPIFLSSPKQQNTQDPQSLNAYSYSEDNPIIKSDPNGKWYIDLNLTYPGLSVGLPFYGLSMGPGGTMGLMFSQTGIYGYAGSAVAIPAETSVSANFSFQNPSEGWSQAIAGYLPEYYVGGQLGVSESNGTTEPFAEVGVGSPGIVASAYYVKKLQDIGCGNDCPDTTGALSSINAQNIQTGSALNYANQIYSSGRAPSTVNNGSTIQSASNSGGSLPIFVGQSPSLTYSFSGGVNGYGETWNQVFPNNPIKLP